MLTPQILVLGRFSPEDLVVTLGSSNRLIDPSLENQLESLWRDRVARARQENRHIYNGTIYRLNQLQEIGTRLSLEFGTIDFKTLDGLQKLPAILDLPESYYSKACYSCATVCTTDGRYLMAELSGRSLNTNPIDHLGGVMEMDGGEFKTGRDVFQCLFQELNEEAGLKEVDIREVFLRSIFLGRRATIGFYFEVMLNIDVETCLKRFVQAPRDPDVSILKFYTRDEYLELLGHHNANKQLIATIFESGLEV